MSNFDPMDIRSQERIQAQADERNELAQRIEVDDLKWLMSNKRGRRFVFRLLERAGVWRLSFNTNALTMAFNEGTRNEGLRLLDQIATHCPDRHTDMLKESKE
jgi:hypothetical protein